MSVLRHVMTGYYHTNPSRRVSLEGLVAMLAAARPTDFNMGGGIKVRACEGIHADSQLIVGEADHCWQSRQTQE